MTVSIDIDTVCKKLGKRQVLHNVTFNVVSGDIFGYLGPNGAGKTTTIRILLGLLEADSGIVKVLGQDVRQTETRLKVGFSLDPDGLYDSMTAEENLQYYADIYGITDSTGQIDKVLDLVDLADRAGDRVGTYSKGMRQRLALARSMVHNPDVLILDEPTSGVDPSGQIEIRKILLNIARNEKKTVLLSSHNLDEVQRICNRVAFIDKGEIKLYGDLEMLRRKAGRSSIIVETGEPLPEQGLDELRSRKTLGFREANGAMLYFDDKDDGPKVSDIVSFLAARGVKIEKADRTEASLEDLYASILDEAEDA